MLAQQQNQMTTMMKGKRTKRSRTASPLTLTMSSDDSCRVTATSSSTTTTNVDRSPTPNPTLTEEEEDMANCLILLAQGASKTQKLTHTQLESQSPATVTATTPPPTTGVFVYECKTCNRCFTSFQALGGHRASHRKPKLPVTVDPRGNQEYFQLAENNKIKKVEELGLSLQMACNSSNTLSASNNNNESNNNKSCKVHACGICGAEFSSGQALGGHMRRHRPIATGSPAASPPAPTKNLLCLDLNLPADEEEEEEMQPQKPAESHKFIFGSTEKTLVFANSLVDCRY